MGKELQTTSIRLEREIFLGALERSGTKEREAFLASACGADARLRRRIEELLQEEQSTGNFLQRPVWRPKQGPMSETESLNGAVAVISEQPGDKIGQYTLVERIGEGGCGIVYKARQEEPFRREVALKVIKLGMDTRQVIARFEAERQTLALMNHSSIAKVFDAGATWAGRPFFVMELVQGIKLTEHCDRNCLELEERLGLFMQVCIGIEHAHQKGVIHRDIKPSNILVATEDGEAVPKIIDFGIARAIHPQMAAQLTEITGFGQLIGTPAYMSPEQATPVPVDIDTRSDIYSLGILLYELLTGRTPFDSTVLAQDPDEWRTIIRDQEPVRPSARLAALTSNELAEQAEKLRTEPARLVAALRGDLDWVVMKALDKERSRRYATAREFAQEVEDYLADKPVLARPPSKRYRLQKLVRRHRTAAIALSGAVAVLIVATAISAGLAVRATRAETDARLSERMQVQLRRQAELEREKAQAQAAAARLNEYVADINLAQQSLDLGNYGRAVQLLKKHTPQRGTVDLRGFEWRYLWQLSHGDDHVAFPGQGSSVRTLAVSPNGRWLAVGTDDRLNLWDLLTGALARTLPLHQISAVFCAEGRELVVSSPSEVRVLDFSAGTERSLPEQDGGSLAVSKDGKHLAVSGSEGVRIWNTEGWINQTALAGAFAPVTFSPDGQLLASAAREGITIWDLASGKPKLVLQNSANLFQFRGWDQLGRVMVFTPDGLQLIAPRNRPFDNGGFQLSAWNVQSGEPCQLFGVDPQRVQHTGTIAWLAVSPDGKTLATASMDHSIRVWDLQSQREPAVLHGHLSEVWTIAFSPEGGTLISGAKDGSVNLWSIPMPDKRDLLKGPYALEGFSTDGQRMMLLDQQRGALVWMNRNTKQLEEELTLDSGWMRPFGRITVSADLRVVAEALGSGIIRLYDTATRQESDLNVAETPFFEMALSPDGRQLITGGMGQPSNWWDLISKTNVAFGAEVRRALFSPEGRSVLVLNAAGRPELWDVATRSLRVVLSAQSSLGPAAAFSPDGKVVAIASDPLVAEQMIGVWETKTGRYLGACIGHKQGILGLAFSADGRTLASTSHDSTLKLWNTATLQQLLNFSIPGGVNNPCFSPDGMLLAVGQSFQQKGIRLYSAPLPGVSDLTAGHNATP